MTDQIVRLGPEYFPDPTSGGPISGGSVYIGEPDKDPEDFPITVSALQENGSTVPISQPISTSAGGVPLYNGSPVTLIVSESYSLKVLDNSGQRYYVPSTIVSEDTTDPNVEYVEDIIGLINISSPIDDQTHIVLSFFDGLNQGGGVFYWDSTVDKATANGGTIVDPDNIGGFDGTVSTLAAFLTAQGGGVGSGCWMRLYNDPVFPEWFGVIGDGVEDDTAAIDSCLKAADYEVYFESGSYLFNVTLTKDIKITSEKAVFMPKLAGKVIESDGFTFEIYNTEFQLGDAFTTSSDFGIYIINSPKVRIVNCDFVEGGYQLWVKDSDDIVVELNTFKEANQWPNWFQGVSNVVITRNHSKDAKQFDGFKVAGNQEEVSADLSKNIIISHNISETNFRDGIDIAVNDCHNVTVTNNILIENKLRSIDIKALDNGAIAQELKRVNVINNTCVQLTNDGTGISVQNNTPSVTDVYDFNIIDNDIYIKTGSVEQGILCSGLQDSVIKNNIIKGGERGIRFQNDASSNIIKQNTLLECKIGILFETLGHPGAPDDNICHDNKIDTASHANPSNAVQVTHGDNNAFYNNDITIEAADYSLKAENLGEAATNTKWYNNTLGLSVTLPTGYHVVVGDVFTNPEVLIGMPKRWSCIVQDSGSDTSSMRGSEQVGFRLNAGDPNGSLTPQFTSEELYDTTNTKWWKAYGTANTHWA